MRKYLYLRPIIAFGLIVAFLLNSLGPVSWAQEDPFYLPKPGQILALSPSYNPPILKGLKVHPNNPFKFDFIVDQGDSPSFFKERARGSSLKEESTKLIKYFLASLTIPQSDLWVNLSPYEKNRIIPQSFGQTEMGRDLLAEDYILKQITSSLMFPEGETGKKFWKRIYAEAASRFGTTNVPVNTFNKVWIVPDKAVVYENAKAGTAYVVESKLKVMLEKDYLSIKKHQRQPGDIALAVSPCRLPSKEGLTLKAPQGNDYMQNGHSNLELNPSVGELGSQVIREIIIPELDHEVNEGQNFAQLRQVYNSLILAAWYKKKIRDSILAAVYENKSKIKGLSYSALPTRGHGFSRVPMQVAKQESFDGASDPEESTQSPNQQLNPNGNPNNDVDQIYQQYLQAFKKGAYNYIKEEQDPLTQQEIQRKYFSGGTEFTNMAMNAAFKLETTLDDQDLASNSQPVDITVQLKQVGFSRVGDILVNHAMKATDKAMGRLDNNFNHYFNGSQRNYENTFPFKLVEGIKLKYFGSSHPPIILNIGAGEGDISGMMYKDGLSVIGVDINPNYVLDSQSKAKQRNWRLIDGHNTSEILTQLQESTQPAVSFTLQDASNLQLPDNSIDAVVLHRVLSLISDEAKRDQILKEVYRILKPGGVLSFLDYPFTSNVEDQRNAVAYARSKQVLELMPLLRPAILNNPAIHPMLVLEDSLNKSKTPDLLATPAEQIVKNLKEGTWKLLFIGLHEDISFTKSRFEDYGFISLGDQQTELIGRSGKRNILKGFLFEKPDAAMKPAADVKTYQRDLTEEEIERIIRDHVWKLTSGGYQYNVYTSPNVPFCLKIEKTLGETMQAYSDPTALVSSKIRFLGLHKLGQKNKERLLTVFRTSVKPVIKFNQLIRGHKQTDLVRFYQDNRSDGLRIRMERLKDSKAVFPVIKIDHEINLKVASKFSLVRSYKASSVIVQPLADVLETVIRDLLARGDEDTAKIIIRNAIAYVKDEIWAYGVFDESFNLWGNWGLRRDRQSLKDLGLFDFGELITDKDKALRRLNDLKDYVGIPSYLPLGFAQWYFDYVQSELSVQEFERFWNTKSNSAMISSPKDYVASLRSALSQRIETLQDDPEVDLNHDKRLAQLFKADELLSQKYESRIAQEISRHRAIRVLQLNQLAVYTEARQALMAQQIKERFAKAPPSVITLQETVDDKQGVNTVKAIADELGFDYVKQDYLKLRDGSKEGVAIVYPRSFDRIITFRNIFEQQNSQQQPPLQTAFLGIKLRSRITGKSIFVFTSKLPHQRTTAGKLERRQFIDKMIAYIHRVNLNGDPVIFAADFNYMDEDEGESVEANIGNFIDSFRSVNPKEVVRGISTSRQFRNAYFPGERPDRVYALGLTPIHSQMTLNNPPVSDHLGVLTDFTEGQDQDLYGRVDAYDVRTILNPDSLEKQHDLLDQIKGAIRAGEIDRETAIAVIMALELGVGLGNEAMSSGAVPAEMENFFKYIEEQRPVSFLSSTFKRLFYGLDDSFKNFPGSKFKLEGNWQDRTKVLARTLNQQWKDRGLDRRYGSIYYIVTNTITTEATNSLDESLLLHEWLFEFISQAPLEEKSICLWMMLVGNIMHLRFGGMHPQNKRKASGGLRILKIITKPANYDLDVIFGTGKYIGVFPRYLQAMEELAAADKLDRARVTVGTSSLNLKDILWWGVLMGMDPTVHNPKYFYGLMGFTPMVKRLLLFTKPDDYMKQSMERNFKRISSAKGLPPVFSAVLKIDEQEWNRRGLIAPPRIAERYDAVNLYYRPRDVRLTTSEIFSFILNTPANKQDQQSFLSEQKEGVYYEAFRESGTLQPQYNEVWGPQGFMHSRLNAAMSSIDLNQLIEFELSDNGRFQNLRKVSVSFEQLKEIILYITRSDAISDGELIRIGQFLANGRFLTFKNLNAINSLGSIVRINTFRLFQELRSAQPPVIEQPPAIEETFPEPTRFIDHFALTGNGEYDDLFKLNMVKRLFLPRYSAAEGKNKPKILIAGVNDQSVGQIVMSINQQDNVKGRDLVVLKEQEDEKVLTVVLNGKKAQEAIKGLGDLPLPVFIGKEKRLLDLNDGEIADLHLVYSNTPEKRLISASLGIYLDSQKKQKVYVVIAADAGIGVHQEGKLIEKPFLNDMKSNRDILQQGNFLPIDIKEIIDSPTDLLAERRRDRQEFEEGAVYKDLMGISLRKSTVQAVPVGDVEDSTLKVMIAHRDAGSSQMSNESIKSLALAKLDRNGVLAVTRIVNSGEQSIRLMDIYLKNENSLVYAGTMAYPLGDQEISLGVENEPLLGQHRHIIYKQLEASRIVTRKYTYANRNWGVLNFILSEWFKKKFGLDLMSGAHLVVPYGVSFWGFDAFHMKELLTNPQARMIATELESETFDRVVALKDKEIVKSIFESLKMEYSPEKELYFLIKNGRVVEIYVSIIEQGKVGYDWLATLPGSRLYAYGKEDSEKDQILSANYERIMSIIDENSLIKVVNAMDKSKEGSLGMNSSEGKWIFSQGMSPQEHRVSVWPSLVESFNQKGIGFQALQRGDDLNVENGSVSLLFACNVLMHMNKQERDDFTKMLKAKLKEGGIFVSSFSTADTVLNKEEIGVYQKIKGEIVYRGTWHLFRKVDDNGKLDVRPLDMHGDQRLFIKDHLFDLEEVINGFFVADHGRSDPGLEQAVRDSLSGQDILNWIVKLFEFDLAMSAEILDRMDESLKNKRFNFSLGHKQLPVVLKIERDEADSDGQDFRVLVYPLSFAVKNLKEPMKAGFSELRELRKREPALKGVPPRGTLGQIAVRMVIDQAGDPVMIFEENQSSYGFYGIKTNSLKKIYLDWVYEAHSLIIALAVHLGVKHIYAIPADSVFNNYARYSNGEISSSVSGQNLKRHYVRPYQDHSRWILSKIPASLYQLPTDMLKGSEFTDVWEYHLENDPNYVKFSQIPTTEMPVGRIRGMLRFISALRIGNQMEDGSNAAMIDKDPNSDPPSILNLDQTKAYLEGLMLQEHRKLRNITSLGRYDTKNHLFMTLSAPDYDPYYAHVDLISQAHFNGGFSGALHTEWMKMDYTWDNQGRLNEINLAPPDMSNPREEYSIPMLAFLDEDPENVATSYRDKYYQLGLRKEILTLGILFQEAAVKAGLDPKGIKVFVPNTLIWELSSSKTNLDELARIGEENAIDPAMDSKGKIRRNLVGGSVATLLFGWVLLEVIGEMNLGQEEIKESQWDILEDKFLNLNKELSINEQMAIWDQLKELARKDGKRLELRALMQRALKQSDETVPKAVKFYIQNLLANERGIKDLRKNVAMIAGNRKVEHSSTGGIDMSSQKDFIVQDGGQGIKFHIDPAMLAEYRDASGFVPVIIYMESVKDLKGFLTSPAPF